MIWDGNTPPVVTPDMTYDLRMEAEMKTLLGVAGVIAILAAIPPSLSAQWPPHPTGAPRTAGGPGESRGAHTQDARRQAGSLGPLGERSDRTGQKIVATDPEPSPVNFFWNIGSGMKDRAPGLGRDGEPPLPAVGGGASQEAHGRRSEGQSGRPLSADRPDPAAQPSPTEKDHPDAEAIVILYEANGGVRQIFMDGRPVARQRSAALVVRLLDRAMGRRHAGGRDDGVSGRRMARRQRQPADRRGEE